MRKKIKIILPGMLLLLLLLYFGCGKGTPAPPGYKTQNVIVVVVDGPRYTETWGLPSHQFIPHRSALLKEGVMCSRFYNNGITATVPGHTAICTGVYQNIENTGLVYPANPSVFQCWLKQFHRPASNAWVITTKDKLDVLTDCTNPEWKDVCRPMKNCGNMGLFTGNCEDSTTVKRVLYTLTSDHPRLMMVNFKQPDAAGHANDSAAYLRGISDTDKYIYQLWNQIQSDDFYKDKTALIVTNDHGRHTAGKLDGYISHGDNCDGCRHIEFFALGPDFKKNYISNISYEQIDIAATIAELMNFKMPYSNGKVMKDILSR